MTGTVPAEDAESTGDIGENPILYATAIDDLESAFARQDPLTAEPDTPLPETNLPTIDSALLEPGMCLVDPRRPIRLLEFERRYTSDRGVAMIQGTIHSGDHHDGRTVSLREADVIDVYTYARGDPEADLSTPDRTENDPVAIDTDSDPADDLSAFGLGNSDGGDGSDEDTARQKADDGEGEPADTQITLDSF